MNKLLACCLTCVTLTGCVTFAPPSPLLTLGGPATTPREVSEVGFAVGGGGVMFDGGSEGGIGALGRYKRGVTDRFDLGVDAVFADYSDNTAFSAKLAGRYQLAPNWRLEGGLGGADASEGKSTNGDIGITFGTRDWNRTWNWYTTLRVGGAKGHGGDDPPADSFFGLFSLGAQATLNRNQRFVVEGGVGSVSPEGHSTDPMMYLTMAMLFDLGDAP